MQKTWPVLIIVGDATETLDTMYPYYRLQEAGVSTGGRGTGEAAISDGLARSQTGWTITKEWEGYTIQATWPLARLRKRSIWASFFRCRAPEYIRYDEDLMRVTKYFFAKNLPIASVCHGVEIPATADCVRGRRMATVPSANLTWKFAVARL